MEEDNTRTGGGGWSWRGIRTEGKYWSRVSGCWSSKSLRDEGWGSWNDKLGVPYFVANQTHLVLAPLDHTTYLHCIVGNLGDRQVHPKKTNLYID